MVERAPPANLRPYVEALGADDAERVFLALGGSQIYVPNVRVRSTEPSALFEVVGDAARIFSLSDALDKHGVSDGGYVKVPLARRWVAERMWSRGESSNVIARTIRCDVATVRRWLDRPSVNAA